MSSPEQDVASPAAAVLERRLNRTTPEKRKLPCGVSGSEGSEKGSEKGFVYAVRGGASEADYGHLRG